MTELVCRECDTYYSGSEDCCPDCGSYSAGIADDAGWVEIG